MLYKKALKKWSKHELEQEMFGKIDWKAGETALKEDLSGWGRLQLVFLKIKPEINIYLFPLKISVKNFVAD